MGHLAGVLRSLREEAALTQEELAARAGLSARTISDIERGLRKRLYRDTAERLGVGLGLEGAALTEFVDLGRGRGTDLRRELDADFRRRFVAWHVDRVSALAGQIGHEHEWYAVLDADEANLAVALRWADEAGDAEALLQLGTGLWRYWQERGQFATGRTWLERGLRATPPAGPATRMTALWGLAWLSHQQGDDASAAAYAEELTALADEAGEVVALRNAATARGIVCLDRDEIAKALSNFDDALVLARDAEQPWLVATSLLNLGIARIAAGDTPRARAVLGEAIREYDELGDERFRARSLGYLGLAALVDGDAERGRALYRQSLTLFGELGDDKGVAEALVGLATAAAMDGRPLEAAQLAGAAERVREPFAGRPLPVERRLAETHLAHAQEAAGAGPWRDAWTSGRACRPEEAIAFALGVGVP